MRAADAAAEDDDPSDRIVVVPAARRPERGGVRLSRRRVRQRALGSVTHSSAMTRMVIPHDGPRFYRPGIRRYAANGGERRGRIRRDDAQGRGVVADRHGGRGVQAVRRLAGELRDDHARLCAVRRNLGARVPATHRRTTAAT